ncbi:hypothetical protein DFH06DRAFT_1383146 [Mycena polygramma]|nr:hypothetical protein DFH06DRAFT_1383146 [Mycena polygramma]
MFCAASAPPPLRAGRALMGDGVSCVLGRKSPTTHIEAPAVAAYRARLFRPWLPSARDAARAPHRWLFVNTPTLPLHLDAASLLAPVAHLRRPSYASLACLADSSNRAERTLVIIRRTNGGSVRLLLLLRPPHPFLIRAPRLLKRRMEADTARAPRGPQGAATNLSGGCLFSGTSRSAHEVHNAAQGFKRASVPHGGAVGSPICANLLPAPIA